MGVTVTRLEPRPAENGHNVKNTQTVRRRRLGRDGGRGRDGRRRGWGQNRRYPGRGGGESPAL